MSFALLSILAGCSGAGDAPSDGLPVDGSSTPSLTLLSPTAGSAIDDAFAQVTGRGVLLDAVSVNGLDAGFDGVTWSATTPLQTGLNTFEVLGTSGDLQFRDLRSIVAGPTQIPEGFVPGAVHVHLGADILADLSPLASAGLDPAALQTQLQALNPVVETDGIAINIGTLDFGAVDLSLVPGDGVLEVGVIVNDFTLDLDIDGAPLGIDAAQVQVDALVFTLGIVLGTSGQGALTVEVLDPNVQFVDFDFDLDNWLIDLFVSDGDIEDLLLEQIDLLLLDLPILVDQAVLGLDLRSQSEILGQSLVVDPKFASARVTPDGIDLGLDIAADLLGGPAATTGHLQVGAAPAMGGDGIGVQLSDDFMNRFLHELWGGGALNLDLPIAPGDAAGLLLQQMGGVAGAGGSMSLVAEMAPVFVGRDGASRLQLGEVALTVGTPGGAYGETLEFTMALDARASFAIEGANAGIQISDAQVLLVPRGAAATNPELLAKIPQIQATLGFGLGALSDLLSFPLGDPATPMDLPALDVVRDPTGRSTRIGLGGDALYTLITGEAPPPPPHPLDPQGQAHSEPIPFDVIVYDDDATVPADGVYGWVCSRDEVVATGNDGVWFVDGRGDLVVEGTGHVIYANDNANVVLHGAGNIVIADPGADVTDTNGTNTLFVADPLDFDESAVSNGC